MRQKGEGSFETRNGKWRVSAGVNGRRIKGPWAKTKPEALLLYRSKSTQSVGKRSAAATLALKPLISELLTEGSAHPFLGEWRSRWEQSTYDRFLKHLKALRDSPLANKTLSSITDRDLRQARPHLGGTPKTRKNRLDALAELGRMAGVTLPKIRAEQAKEPEFVIVMPHEAEELMALATDDFDRLVFGLLYYCGLRSNEAAGLKRSDYKDGELLVQRSAVATVGQIIVKPYTKTKQARRVPVPKKWLRDLLESRPPGYILFRDTPATPISASTIHNVVARRARPTRFRGLNPLGLRHSAATAFALSGVSIDGAAAIMGHNAAILRTVYARYRPDVRMGLSRQAFGGD